MFRFLLALVFMLAMAGTGSTQLTLEKDINDEGASSFPSYGTLIDNYIYLNAKDEIHGDELWRINIDTETHELVADINEGVGSSQPLYLKVIDGRLYFTADNSRRNRELVYYDPNLDEVTPVQPEGLSELSVAGNYVQVGDKLLFATEVSRNNDELGVYDLTTNEFELITVGSDGDSDPGSFAVVGNTVWFLADTGGERQFWTYDAQTNMIANANVSNPSGASLSATDPLLLDNRIYYSGFIQGEGTDLYALDLTSKTVVSFDPIFNGPGSANPREFTAYDDKMYFIARPGGLGNNLYVFDPSTNNYESLSGIMPNDILTTSGLQVYDEKLFFIGSLEDQQTNQLFNYDVSSGVFMRYDIKEYDEYSNQLGLQIIINDIAYINLYDPSVGQELHRFNLNTDELELLADINPTTIGSSPFGFTAFNDKLYFAAQAAFEGRKLFVYDPSDGSIGGANEGRGGEDASNLVEYDGKLYFAGISNDGVYGIQYYDPVTEEVEATSYQTPNAFGGIQELVVYNDKLFFDGDNDTEGREIYFYDPDTRESGVVADINPDGDSNAEDYFVFDNELFFTASTPEFGNELWKYNDFTGEVTRLTDIGPGSDGSNIFPLIEYNNKLFFFPRSGDNGGGQWHSYDPSTEEITQETNESSSLNVDWAAIFDNQLYFSGRLTSRISGELIAFDDLADSLRLVADLNGSSPSNPRYLTVFNDKLYFQATTEELGSELWEHLGGVGASVVTDINPGVQDSDPRELTVFNDKLYFQATDGLRGEEIWSLASCLNVVVESTTPQLDDDPTGSIDIEVTGGTPPYIYEWDNGEEVEDISDLLAGDYELIVKDQSGCLTTITVTVAKETTTDNEELTEGALIEVYPNPAQDYLVINHNKALGKGRLSLLDSHGALRLSQELGSDRTNIILNVQELPSGFYYLYYRSDEEQTVTRFLKM